MTPKTQTLGTLLTLALTASVAIANPLNTGGQSGVAHTTTTYALGQGSINTGLSVKADYAYHDVMLTNADGTTSLQSPVLLSQDAFIGYGVTNWLDASLDLPLYQDIWANHTDKAVGIGDLQVGFKVQHPGLYQEAPFQVAYLLRATFPTASEDAGYFQRHTYYSSRFSATEGGFGTGGFSLNPTMIWSLDFSKFPSRIPLALNANLGGFAQAQEGEQGSHRRYHSALLGNFAAEYQVNPKVSVFGEISGEAKLYDFIEGYNFTTDLRNDVLRFALGSTYKMSNGLQTSLSLDLAISDWDTHRIEWQKANDDGVVEKYTTSNTPRVGLNLTVGYAKRGKDAKHVAGRFFAPEDTVTITKIDTVLKYDTLQVRTHDTLEVVKNDTIKVQVRDTVLIVKNDTLKVVQNQSPQTIIQYGVLVFPSINFETGSAKLTTGSYATLNDIAQSMNTFPEVKVEVRGYTDVTGTVERNKVISQERAQSVIDYLSGKGVNKARLVAVGLGASNPIADNGTTEGRVLNRRVEIKRIDVKK